MGEQDVLLPNRVKRSRRRLLTQTRLKTAALSLAVACLVTVLLLVGLERHKQAKPGFHLDKDIHVSNHCPNVGPINRTEFLNRQSALVELLQEYDATAYIAEPGASAAFFGNISTTAWRLSERPLLLIVDVTGKTHVLTPKFEATRAKLLAVPSSSEINYIEWGESEDPYRVLASALPDEPRNIFVDSSIRNFLVDGLQAALPAARVKSAPRKIVQLRERKSSAEINILKCANEVWTLIPDLCAIIDEQVAQITILAIRDVQKRLRIGVRESEARSMIAETLSAAGLHNGGCLTLFGENAALPHGSGTDRTLGESDYVLFDCTANLHGYWSDVTRTLALATTKIPRKHLQLWKHVSGAQYTALITAGAGVPASQVDHAARRALQIIGYGEYFTHRLGHGIGLEVHEAPYLHGGNNNTLEGGHTFSNEPGIYIEGEVGIRLEDCVYIDETGAARLLTEGVGGRAKSPLDP